MRMLGVSFVTECFEALFVPDAMDSLELIKLIPAMVVTNIRDYSDLTCFCKLLDFEWMVVLPLWALEACEDLSAGDSDSRPNRKVSVMRAAESSHADA